MQPGFVLHRRDYRDTSVLLEFFTRDDGRIAAVAKGAKLGKRRLSGVLQAFVPLLVSYQGRGEVLTLRKVEAVGAPFPFAGRRLYCGLYVNELMLKLTVRADPHPVLFSRYLEVLGELVMAEEFEQPLRLFELDLLGTLGFGPQLAVEADGRTPIAADSYYDYRVDVGVIPMPDHGWLSGRTLLALAHREVLHDAQTRHEARQLLRLLINSQLGAQSLRSRELFRKLR